MVELYNDRIAPVEQRALLPNSKQTSISSLNKTLGAVVNNLVEAF
jgi:hypothetical protein